MSTRRTRRSQRRPAEDTLLSRPQPIEKISDDILYYIFLLMVEEEAFIKSPQRDVKHYLGPSLYPWTQASVCRSWRRTCLAHATLWTHINFSWHYCEESWYTRRRLQFPSLRQTRLKLERSRNAPLFIYAGKVCNCKSQKRLYRAVAAHSGRWEEVHLGYAEADATRAIKPLISKNTGFHNLSKICFRGASDNHVEHSLPFPAGCNATLENLRYLTMRSVGSLPGSRSNFPWHQLACLNFDPYTGPLAVLCAALSECKALEHLNLHFQSTYVEEIHDDPNGPVFDMPHLISFTIYEATDDLLIAPPKLLPLHHLLPQLRLPSLRCLKMDVGDIWGTEWMCIVASLIQRSSCSLTELYFCIKYSGDDDMETLEMSRRLLHAVPNVRTLTFGWFQPYEPLLDAFCDIVAEPHIFPYLEQLRLHFEPVKVKRLLKIIETRMDNKNLVSQPWPLRSLRMIYPAHNDDSDPLGDETMKEIHDIEQLMGERLKKFINEGLELSFFSYTECLQSFESDNADPDEFCVGSRTDHLY